MKRNYLAIVTLLLIAPLLLAPVQASITTYVWDNIRYVQGTSIDYPHPDRDYYDISISSDWTAAGTKLCHNQINHDASEWVAGAGIIGVCALIGLAIGTMIDPGYGSAAGTAAGIVLGMIASGAGVVFKDECGCIWWWVSISFVTWLDDNAWWLVPLYLNPLTQSIAVDAITAAFLLYGYFRIGPTTIYDAVGAGSPAPPPPSGGGGSGCPYVSGWNGTRYVLDNNILPASETSNGVDVEDYYRLEQMLVPTYEGQLFSLYSLQVSEFEHEHSYLDQAKLLAVDHSSGVDVAVSPIGEILTYSNPAPAIFAVDDNGVDVLSQLNSMDGTYYQGCNGSCVTLTFASTDVSNGVKLVIREDVPPNGPPLLKCPVYVQVAKPTGDWNTVAVFHTRTYWATDIINMTGYLPDANGDLKVRFCFVSTDKIDYVGLDTTPQANIEVHQAFLLSALHSTQGNVRPLLTMNDQTYAELIPGQRIQLAFLLPNQNEERTFILYTEGHYSTIAP
jgi:hypothetical protein